jgi:hypothetical protein
MQWKYPQKPAGGLYMKLPLQKLNPHGLAGAPQVLGLGLAAGLALGFAVGLVVGFGLGDGWIEVEGDGRTEGAGECPVVVAVGVGEPTATTGRVWLLFEEPDVDSAEPTMTAAISSALNPPPPMSKPVVQGDRDLI